jgi:hypothetical protein
MFLKRISLGHALCVEPDMRKVLPPQDINGEPTPKFASDAEIELAEQLRHKLEKRYFEESAAPPSLRIERAKAAD